MNKAGKASHDQQQANIHQWYRKQKLHHAVYVNTEKLNSKSVYFFFKEDTLCKTECKKDKKGHTKWLKAMGMFIFSPLSSFEWRLKYGQPPVLKDRIYPVSKIKYGTKTLGIGSPKRKPKKNGATIGFTVWYQVKQEKNAMLSWLRKIYIAPKSWNCHDPEQINYQ